MDHSPTENCFRTTYHSSLVVHLVETTVSLYKFLQGQTHFQASWRAVLYPKEMIWVIFVLPTTRQKKKGNKILSMPKEPLQISKSYIGTY